MHASIQFDKKDRELLKMINDVLDNGLTTSEEKEVLSTSLHPHGIQNMVDTHEVRMALAVINLLERLGNNEGSRERLAALKTLHNEVVYSAQTSFKFNTSRVLIQIMKELVRARGNVEEQLKLIHDFQKAAAGNPRIVRHYLTKYFLLEMPEEWNQKTLDDHVHDSSTRGRKNPTYLVMDARVKGIRRLSVVYYNFIDPNVAFELMEAASIMGITVRIGIKLKAVHNGKYLEFIWTPRGFTGPHSIIEFLQDPKTRVFLEKGRKAEEWASKQVIKTLHHFNQVHVPSICAEYKLPEFSLDEQKFMNFIASSQISLVHLAEFAHISLLPLLTAKADAIKKEMETADEEKRKQLREELDKLDALSPQTIYLRWVHPKQNPNIPNLIVPQDDDRPDFLKYTIEEFLCALKKLRPNSRVTLLTSFLEAKDVLELLWDNKGLITHLEVFNLKDWLNGRLTHLEEINDLQVAINQKNVLKIKHIILKLLQRDDVKNDAQLFAKLNEILQNIPKLINFYSKEALGSRFGTDSTNSLGTRFGMGLAVPETLPRSAQKLIGKKGKLNPIKLPLNVPLSFSDIYEEPLHQSKLQKWIRHSMGWLCFGLKRRRDWKASYANAYISGEGNIITLGGRTEPLKNGFVPNESKETKTETRGASFSYMNTTLLNVIKVTLGFLPAFLTFMLTQNWWVLAWFGALIWFSITGIRNIIQAIISGGGFQKGARIDWRQLINWSRISDSLMYTGLSVVLLEGFTRNVVLGHILGITVDKAPLLVFSIIALANGLYISSHNIFRGFPKTAVVGNLFRSILAIPVAMVYNVILAMILPVITGMPAAAILVPAAAIVSKFASDTVAGVIESFADRRNNYRLRTSDFSMAVSSLFSCFTHLELSFPEKDILQLMKKPSEFVQMLSAKAPSLEIECFIISLDLMYMWYYQPCARQAFLTQLKRMTPEERLIYVRFQRLLSEYKEVSRLFLSGMLGNNFSHALAFYLDNYKDYLRSIDEIRLTLDSKEISTSESSTQQLLSEKSKAFVAEVKATFKRALFFIKDCRIKASYLIQKVSNKEPYRPSLETENGEIAEIKDKDSASR